MALEATHSAGSDYVIRKPLVTPRVRRWIVSVLLAAVCCIWIYPLVWMVSASFKTNAAIFASEGLIPSEPVIDNYLRAWNEANIGAYFFNTLFVTVGSVLLVTIATAMMGYVLGRRKFLGRGFIFGLLVFTMFVPQGYTIIPVFELLSMLGLGQSLWGVMLATTGGSFVIFVLLFAGYFSQMPDELEEAAKMDGVGFVRTFWYVMLPLSKPIIVTVIVMQTLYAWNDFLLPLVVTLANPAIRTLSVGVYAFKGENFVDWGGMTAASTITIVPVVVLFLFLQRYFIDGLAGAVKG
ncbi:carbohydrate ABC transporter permease [Devosia rhodophyticola]|uniref:sn-glycerol-3-phosphate transport system permease protein UgpE n=1 Tax=Devosia rhodophyticola TaxID=3026423 RepID=A0ABY7YW64_9HYPH|nr:carbohydrate ABC transporter permease [Devosia rhodophyticola]WDR05184.1 carbohydrate ABC transporter permease [Devosia rhodophyticola]